MVEAVSFCGNLDKELNYEFEIVRYASLQLLQPYELVSAISRQRFSPQPNRFSTDQLARLGFHGTGTVCGVKCFSCEMEHRDIREFRMTSPPHRAFCLFTSDRAAGNNVPTAEYGEAHLTYDMGKLRCEVCRHNHVNSIDVITGKLRHCDVCAGKHAIVLRDAGVRYNRVF